MRILVTGAAGMIGRKLMSHLAGGMLGTEPVEALVATDLSPPEPPPTPFPVEPVAADLAGAGTATQLVAGRPDVIFHLAAVVSGEAESDFDKGYAVNLDGTRALLDAVRATGDGYRPRVVFASSIAVFGGPFPEAIGDDFLHAPCTSYGTQKAVCELLLDDYSRRGFLDGVGIRLPTICVRPGAPNRAASGFFSSIVREPLRGERAVLPVPDDVRHWHASPRAAVGFLVHAATLDTSLLGGRRSLTMPGVSVTVAEQIDALRAVAGERAVQLIDRVPDETVRRIVAGWPQRFDPRRARELGFVCESTFAEIVQAHIDDELDGRIPVLS